MKTGPPFTQADLDALSRRGISLAEAQRQLGLLRSPPPSASLLRAATPGDGILVTSESRQRELEKLATREQRKGGMLKFVPASGAASRMFRPLQEEGDAGERLLAQWQRLPFADRLAPLLPAGGPREVADLARAILSGEGLALAGGAKGLVPFHRGPDGVRTAFEEQLWEGVPYVVDDERRCRMHFTVSPDHEQSFRALLETCRSRIESALRCRLEGEFSKQEPSTDTLATDDEGAPFRDDRGDLLFRPGGHGALIANLGRLDAEIVLIKNIDNVLPASRQAEIVRWKKVLGGLLVELRDRIFEHGKRIEGGRAAAVDLERASSLLRESFGAECPPREGPLLDRLRRPLRVCGVVPNAGEPGGGPFWVADQEHGQSCQIVEGAQIDLGDSRSRAALEGATHFNPVDLVCQLRDWNGERYHLERFVDPRTAFVAHKSSQGRSLRALERPGLWNGAMARWNTVLVEVPGATFAPVKTLVDLLRDEHQSGAGA